MNPSVRFAATRNEERQISIFDPALTERIQPQAAKLLRADKPQMSTPQREDSSLRYCSSGCLKMA
jgi:hypothetical protein